MEAAFGDVQRQLVAAHDEIAAAQRRAAESEGRQVSELSRRTLELQRELATAQARSTSFTSFICFCHAFDTWSGCVYSDRRLVARLAGSAGRGAQSAAGAAAGAGGAMVAS